MHGSSSLRVLKILVVLFCSFTWLCYGADLLDATKFSQTLSKLATEGLGVADLQQEFDQLQFNEEPVNGTEIILSLTANITNKFKERFNVVRQLKQAVEDAYSRSQSYSRQWQCCRTQDFSYNLEYDSRFRQKVDVTKACLKTSGSARSNLRYLDDSFVKTMEQMLNDFPFIKWQYFGSEEGMLTVFPAFEDKATCPGYDPRYRPWYVETATPEPKDVVLVIDTSGSMSTTLMNVAKEAANTVLSTMNPRDRVRVTNYANAFNAAFRLLKKSYPGQGSTRNMVIIFLTDGTPSDDKTNIMQTIKDRNAELHNKVIIMTYGILVNKNILLDIANQDGTSYGVSMSPGVTPGKFTSVSDTDNLRNAMATYYDSFSKNTESNNPIISVPYIDAAGLGKLKTFVYFLGN
ncbi:hypothetical protein OS493_031707 [Desmophyllum pertusum]|uniref:VWFA domain-containing protein n=1 Tax=Desmophyllum pertusum TaxID=174260 RepID=A0A9X0D0R2_9CNID|nr:hypothetical protein OS493_031707 [Desmophyllum pertusum]